MPQQSAQRSFGAGELAPALYARTDVQKYAAGLRTCRNFIVQREGGVNMRPGFDYVATTKNSGQVRLIKFVFNNANAFVMEFGNLYIRFYANGAPVESSPGVPVEVTTPYLTADLDGIGYVQSGDVVTLVHQSYPPQKLSRLSNTNWTIGPIVFQPQTAAPTNLVASGTSGVVGVPYTYVVTAINDATGEESLPSVGANWIPAAAVSLAAPTTLNWTAVAGCSQYNVYRLLPGSGLIGVATGTTFLDNGQAQDILTNAPQPFTGFQAPGDYPGFTAYYQQRQAFAGTVNAPEQVWLSQSGNYPNFTVSNPIQDSDAVIFSLAGQQVAAVRFLLDLGRLIVGTEGGEYLVQGDANGTLTPTNINPIVGSYNGANTLPPVRVGNTILYVQALGTRILELKTNVYLGYYSFTGKDLTEYATHLFDGFTLIDWDYQQIPNYVTWAARDDGTLLGFTFNEDEQLMAWHHHDTLGSFENVCVIPEGNEHRVYAVVNRTINGATVRYIERMRSLILLDPTNDASFMDSMLEYDGRNYGALNGNVTLTLSGSGWTETDPLTLTASASEFVAGNVGDGRFLYDSDGTQLLVIISAYLSATTATVFPVRDVPATMQAVALTHWDRSPIRFSGLSTLEGEAVAVYADGFVVGSPNNPTSTVYTVSGGIVTLDNPYAHVKIGLPYLADLETLDIDTPSGPSLKESKIEVTAVGLWVQASRGIWAGRQNPALTDTTLANPTAGLREYKTRNMLTYDPALPPPVITDYLENDIAGAWNVNGRVFIRQIDPVPLNVLAAIPYGYV